MRTNPLRPVALLLGAFALLAPAAPANAAPNPGSAAKPASAAAKPAGATKSAGAAKPAGAARPLAAEGETNRPVELTLQSDRAYGDPFNEVTLDVVVTEPSGVQRRIPAFWAGGSVFRFRYSSPNPGAHAFVTECSDASNAGLHGLRGTITLRPYAGENPLYRHGAPRVSDDRRHFAHGDGTPFFWLGDTWWMGLAKRLSTAEFQQLAADRRDKGFTVVQIVAGLYPDMPAFDERGLGEAGFPWERDWTAIRPEYFDAADRRIQHLADQGLVPAILASWGYYLPWLGVPKMKQHWRYLVARWGALPVVWVGSGEQDLHWYLSGNKPAEKRQLKEGWTEVLRDLRRIDGFHRLVTAHPISSARDTVSDPYVLDFEMQQTGHGSPPEKHALAALRGWQRQPVMPVMSGESRYEALEVKPMLTAREARQAFWAHLLNSGCAGHTYGANGIWQVNRAGQPFGKSPGGNDWGSMPWDEAMRLPGARQLAEAKRFLLTLPWHKLEVATDLVTAKGRPEGSWSVSAAGDGSLALVYTLAEGPLSVDLARFAGPVTARWFDPTTGKAQDADAALPAKGRRDFAPPGKNAAGDADWVLVLTAGRGVAAGPEVK